MRIGYSYWGFLGDNKVDGEGKEISAPDGNATYGWSIIWEMQRRGHTVVAMQEDRDYPGWKKFGAANFAAFSQEKRVSAYENLRHTFGSIEILPELDVLLIEWRFPIPGRNCIQTETGGYAFPMEIQHGIIRSDMQPDLFRQMQLINHYKGKKTKIILWDLDHKLESHDELMIDADAVFETSVHPKILTVRNHQGQLEGAKKRTRVEPPFHIPDLLQHPTLPSDVNRKLVYIGSRYERDDVITEWVKPTSDRYPNQVEFWGNWLRTVDECRKLWPNVSYNDRITTKDFRRVYGTAGACPLLAKKSYLETGFITPRPWEALLFGTIPVGLAAAAGIDQYVIHKAHSGDDMIEVAETLCGADLQTRDQCRRDNVEMLEFMDARHFVDKVEAVV